MTNISLRILLQCYFQEKFLQQLLTAVTLVKAGAENRKIVIPQRARLVTWSVLIQRGTDAAFISSMWQEWLVSIIFKPRDSVSLTVRLISIIPLLRVADIKAPQR